jgi:hypothetical protein
VRIYLVTDAWEPQVNGVVRTMKTTARELTAMGHEVRFLTPLEFRTLPCPTYPEIRLSLLPGPKVDALIREFDPDVLHIATEGPLGWAALRAAQSLSLPVTSDFRTNFHQYSRYYGLGWLSPVVCDYLRRFHNQTQHSFVPTETTQRELAAVGFERLELVGRGVDSERYTPDKRSDALRAGWNAGEGPVLL